VKQGDLLFRLDQTTALADAQVAAQRLSVAQAKVEALRSGAFADPKAGHDLPVAEKERDLAQVESDIAQRKLQRTEVRATESGLAIFSSRTELVGKPVRVGEKIMEIADPAHGAYRAELAVHDAIPISDGAEMQVFLDADPLVAHSASLISVSFHAQPEADGKMSYRVMAKSRDEKTPPQLGLRGTAQITGQTSTLGMVLLRRPIAAIRQYLGR
jgi:multidrug resistance efflux pump